MRPLKVLGENGQAVIQAIHKPDYQPNLWGAERTWVGVTPSGSRWAMLISS